MGPLIAVVAGIVVIGGLIALAVRRKSSAPKTPSGGTITVEAGRLRPGVAEFHVRDGAARVHFEVPLPTGAVDQVLADLLGREAVEVVREKRHTLPLGDLSKVVALGRRGADWAEVTSISLTTPGELPPPMLPELIPHAGHRDFDPFDKLGSQPTTAPLTGGTRGERLEGLELKLPARAEAALRAQGIDPAAHDTPAKVLALMRSAGYQLSQTAPDTYRADRGGQSTFVRVLAHSSGDYPELAETDIRKFVVDFARSGAARGVLLSEKWAPFEIHERERRDPRVRFVSRERLQAFVDALVLG